MHTGHAVISKNQYSGSGDSPGNEGDHRCAPPHAIVARQVDLRRRDAVAEFSPSFGIDAVKDGADRR